MCVCETIGDMYKLISREVEKTGQFYVTPLYLRIEFFNFWISEFFKSLKVSHESIRRELQMRPIYECRGDERLKTKVEESTRPSYTGFLGELEHLKIKTRLL